MRRYLLAIIALAAGVCPSAVRAQNHFAQTAVDLPQSMLFNPAMRPERGFVSIPFIGSIYGGFDNSFSYRQVIRKDENGVKYLQTDKLMKAVEGKDLTLLRMNLDLVNTGFYVGPKDYMGVSLRARAHVGTSLPEGLFGWLLDNPLGEYRTFDISMTPNIMSWLELGVSYTRDIDRNWRVGGRVKYLNGLASIQSQGMDVRVRQEYDRDMLSGDYTIRGGNVDFSTNKPFDNLLSNMASNPGFAFDLGATYRSDDERWKASASVSDLGAIFWNKKNSSVIKTHSNGQEYEFYGAERLGKLIDGTTSIGNILDSAYADFGRTLGADTTAGGFTQMLPVTFQAAAEYSIDEYFRHNVSLALLGMIPYHSKFHCAVSAGYAYRSLNGVWQLMGSYTYKTNNPFNIGLGMVMTTGKFQLYLAVDNVVPAFSVARTRGTDFSLGLNFFLARKSLPKKRSI